MAAGLALRVAWPLADIPPRTSWSNGIYTDPAVMVHAARNLRLFGQWILDYNRDLWIFPLMNVLTALAYLPAGPGRLPTVILSAAAGTATIGGIAWGLTRSLGPRAGAMGALLFAFAGFPVMFARVPIAENVTGLLLVLSAGAAVGRSSRAQALAGALGVLATLFGKYHAVGFLPGLVAFGALRTGSLRHVGAMLGGGTLVFAVWLFALFLPHRTDILAHVARQSTGLHGELPFAASFAEGIGEFYNSVRRSWLFFRMPVAGTVGGLFVMWTLLNGKLRRARLADGTAIWAFAFASIWIYYALLPYKAPRYYVLVAPFLAAAAGAGLELAVRATEFRFRAPARPDEHLPLALWIYSFVFVALDALKHYASMSMQYLSQPPSRLSPDVYHAVVSVFSRLDTFRQGLVWAGILGIVLFVLTLWNPEILRALRVSTILPGARLRRLVAGLVAAEVVVGLVGWVWFAVHRTTTLEEVKRSLPEMIRDEAVILGPLAPLLTQDSRHRCLPYFGPPGERGLLEKYGVTHVLVGGDGDRDQLRERYPGLLDSTRIVQIWPLKTLFASTLELRRLPATWKGVPLHDYEPTSFEAAADAAAAGQWEEALEGVDRHRKEGGPEIPEVVSLEAVCWFKLERYAEAEKLLERAIVEWPRDPLNWRNLGVLHLSRGERPQALEALMRSWQLDPENEDLEAMIKELRR